MRRGTPFAVVGAHQPYSPVRRQYQQAMTRTGVEMGFAFGPLVHEACAAMGAVGGEGDSTHGGPLYYKAP